MDSLKNKIIFLTGGSMGIGHACALRYADAGANVAIFADDPASLAEVTAELGAEHLGLLGDVSDASQVREAIDRTLARFGRLDAIHNNAGIAHPSKALHETEDSEWNRLFDVNLRGILNTCKYGIDALKRTKGCILNTSSIVGEIGQDNHAAYAASKGAVNALTKSMAIDYAPFGIRVNAVSPAAVWTPMLRRWSQEQSGVSGREGYLNAIHLLGYCPEANVIADACGFLLSDDARFITGHIMPVTGGAELGYRRQHNNNTNIVHNMNPIG